ncbi:hypothetical protein [Chryseobacterium sp. KMC2]|uniref:hypothetical protein n=1 Tax=Chryseobacterium sp. KMC2 TaxID=2800705 RepID=UPI001921DE33|nr:hypothetical protein [Chryseobacterium sp. KMC2]MBL3546014.1 hypothetical protein [Chryseobacterium sp. KMC2]
MNIMERSKILFGIIFLFFLLGCSIPTDFYIQNLSQTKKTVKINYNRKISKLLKDSLYDSFSFNYENNIVQPRFFHVNKNLKHLEKISIDSCSISLEIEPHSTVRIEKTHNYWWTHMIGYIEIDGQPYDIQELRKNSEEVKHDYIYKIK